MVDTFFDAFPFGSVLMYVGLLMMISFVCWIYRKIKGGL